MDKTQYIIDKPTTEFINFCLQKECLVGYNNFKKPVTLDEYGKVKVFKKNEDIIAFLEQNNNYELGVKLKDTNFIVLDIDNLKNQIPNELYQDLSKTALRVETSLNGLHFWYYVENYEDKLELLKLYNNSISNSQISKNIKANLLIPENTDVLLTQNCIFSIGRNSRTLINQTLSNRGYSLYLLPFPDTSTNIKTGERNNHLFSLGIKYKKSPLLNSFLHFANLNVFEEPLNEREVETIIQSITNYKQYNSLVSSDQKNYNDSDSFNLMLKYNSAKTIDTHSLVNNLKKLEYKNNILASKLCSSIEEHNANLIYSNKKHFQTMLYDIFSFSLVFFKEINTFYFLKNPNKNLWEKVDISHIQQIILVFYEESDFIYTSGNIRDLITLLEYKCEQPIDLFYESQYYIGFSNGVWSTKINAFVAYADIVENKIMIIKYFNEDFVPQEEIPPILNAFLSTSLGEQNLIYKEQKMFLRIFLYLIFSNKINKCNFFVELTGMAGSGKSTLLNLITYIVGPEYVTTTSFYLMEKGDFGLQNLRRDTKILIINEVPKEIDNFPSNFKALTGGDIISVNKKYKQAEEFIFGGIVILTGNNKLRFNNLIMSDTDNCAISRRKAALHFKSRPLNETRDMMYFDSHKQELKGFLIDEVIEVFSWVLSIPEEIVESFIQNREHSCPNVFEESSSTKVRMLLDSYNIKKNLTSSEVDFLIEITLFHFFDGFITEDESKNKEYDLKFQRSHYNLGDNNIMLIYFEFLDKNMPILKKLIVKHNAYASVEASFYSYLENLNKEKFKILIENRKIAKQKNQKAFNIDYIYIRPINSYFKMKY